MTPAELTLIAAVGFALFALVKAVEAALAGR